MDQFVTPPDEPERWLPIGGFEGLYEVSDLSCIRSLPRTFRRSDGKLQHVRGGILKGILKGAPKARYFYVSLWDNGKTRHAAVHALVAEAFLGPRPDGQVVCHGPGGKLDNRLTNLSYGTQVRNCGPDRYRDGTILLGTQVPVSKLNEDKVREIRVRRAAGETLAALACEFGVCRQTITMVVRRKTWRHVA